MKVVVQRVRRASVRVNGETVSAIDAGALVLVGVARGDAAGDAEYLARKTSGLRIFDDAEGRMNLDIRAAGGRFLVVSQFTLCADCRKGNRPSYIEAAAPEDGRRGYEQFVQALRALGHEVQTGCFGENMNVELINDGPVTILLESAGRGRPEVEDSSRS